MDAGMLECWDAGMLGCWNSGILGCWDAGMLGLDAGDMKKYILLLVLILLFWTGGFSFAQDYLLGEGDVLKITVYEHDDLTTTARVSGDGEIVIPLIGPVEAKGLSVSQLSEKITELLADGYIINPQVSIFMEEFRSKKATILGQVSKPGLYELQGYMTFLELISKAGGLSKDAGNMAIIKRKSKTSEENNNVIKIDLIKLIEKGDTSLDISIEDGDSIYIKKAEVIYVSGEVKKPDAYKYEEGSTVIKAITIAGGFTAKGSPNKVKIIRKIKGDETVLSDVKMDEPVLPDDIIVVPESFF